MSSKEFQSRIGKKHINSYLLIGYLLIIIIDNSFNCLQIYDNRYCNSINLVVCCRNTPNCDRKSILANSAKECR